MDISDTLAPTSDQLDAVDLLGGPRTFTIKDVSKGSTEQPVQVYLAEFDRPWRPGKSMRRVLAAAWGADASKWVGRKVRLYCDQRVKFGKEEVGGTRISHLSHIDDPMSVPLLVTRGKSAVFRVDPLRDDPATPEAAVVRGEPTAGQVAECTDTGTLREMWQVSGDERRAQISQRVAELKAEPTADPEPAS